MAYPHHIPRLDHTKYMEFIHKELSPIQDIELLILKGHLLIEYFLNEAIEKLSKAKSGKNALRLKFPDKIAVLELFGMFAFNHASGEKLLNTLATINTLRNKLAHNLQYDKNLIQSLIGSYEQYLTSVKNTGHEMPDDITKLDFLFTGVCGELAGRLDSIIVINNEYVPLTDRSFKERVLASITKYGTEM